MNKCTVLTTHGFDNLDINLKNVKVIIKSTHDEKFPYIRFVTMDNSSTYWRFEIEEDQIKNYNTLVSKFNE